VEVTGSRRGIGAEAKERRRRTGRVNSRRIDAGVGFEDRREPIKISVLRY
jgi:hypothetical protein